jgi:hypothetical protein
MARAKAASTLTASLQKDCPPRHGEPERKCPHARPLSYWVTGSIAFTAAAHVAQDAERHMLDGHAACAPAPGINAVTASTMAATFWTVRDDRFAVLRAGGRRGSSPGTPKHGT